MKYNKLIIISAGLIVPAIPLITVVSCSSNNEIGTKVSLNAIKNDFGYSPNYWQKKLNNDFIFENKNKFNISNIESKDWISLVDWSKMTVEKLQNQQYEYFENTKTETSWNFKFSVSSKDPNEELKNIDQTNQQALIDFYKKIFSETVEVYVSSLSSGIETSAATLGINPNIDYYANDKDFNNFSEISEALEKSGLIKWWKNANDFEGTISGYDPVAYTFEMHKNNVSMDTIPLPRIGNSLFVPVFNMNYVQMIKDTEEFYKKYPNISDENFAVTEEIFNEMKSIYTKNLTQRACVEIKF